MIKQIHKVWQILYLWVRNRPICTMRSEVVQEPSRNWGREYYFTSFFYLILDPWCGVDLVHVRDRIEESTLTIDLGKPPISILGKDMCMQRNTEHLVDDQASTILMETSVLPFPACAFFPQGHLRMLLHICQSDFVSGCNCLVSQNKRMTILSWRQ